MQESIIQKIKQKSGTIDKWVNQVIDNPEQIPELIQAMIAEKGSVKFGCEKVLRLTSEKKPEFIYPYFDNFVQLLESDNTFLKCGAILTLANLTSVDNKNRFENIFDRYYSLISGDNLICAANVIKSSVKIASSKPRLIEKIVEELLNVEKARYKSKGVLSPECKNVACGQALNTFVQIYDKIQNKEPVNRFIKKQLNNTRKSVAKSAEKFLKMFNAS